MDETFQYYLNGFRRRLRPALLLIQQGHFIEAEKSLSKLADTFPRNVAIPALRIICFENIEAYQTAINTADNVSESLNDPETPESA